MRRRECSNRTPFVFRPATLGSVLATVAIALTLVHTSLAQDAQEKNAAGDDARTKEVSLEPPVEVTTPDGTVIPWDRLNWHVPDPETDHERAMKQVDDLRDEAKKLEAEGRHQEAGKKKQDADLILRALEIAKPIRRPKQVRLSLEDFLHRVLANNYTIEVERFNPAIETTRLVEAESVFDAVFFTSYSRDQVDRPSVSALQATFADTMSAAAGIRKALPTGASITGSWTMGRNKTNLQFQTVGKVYNNALVLSVQQPMLRNFGIDANLAQVRIAQNDRRISRYSFHTQVRDVLRQAEEAYWRLVEARRDVVVSARLLAQFEQILDYLDARRDFDVIPVQLAATEANLAQERATFVSRVKNVFDREDQLISLMNSDDLNLADNVEIIPTDFPSLTRVIVDPLAEAQAGIENRPEIKEQELRVKSAKIAVGQAKNQELPRLDLSFSASSSGLGNDNSDAWDMATAYNFIEYQYGVQFEMPIGNRGPRAQYRRAQLAYTQQRAALQQTYENTLLDINVAVRELNTSYDQIGPAFEAAESRVREVDSIVERAERKDINTLNSELAARRSLADARRAMIQFIVDFNVAIIDLERAKGTLLRYNNVVLPSVDED